MVGQSGVARGERGLWRGMPIQVPGRGSSNLAAAAAASHKGVTRARQNEKDSSSDSAEAGNEEFNPLNSQLQALPVLPRASSQLTSTTSELLL